MTCNTNQLTPLPVGCNQDALIASIVRLFTAGSPCESDLPSIIPAFWELAANEACYDNYIRYLIVKREAVLLLMGCEAYSVDSYDRHRRLDGLIVADSHADLRSQSQSTGNSTRFSKGHGETRFDEASNGRSDGLTTRVQRGSEIGDGVSDYRDDGRGNGFNNSQSTSEIDADERQEHLRTVVGSSTETGGRRDCNYEVSQNNTSGDAAALAIALLGFGGGISGGFTGSGSEWRKYTRTSASDSDVSFRRAMSGSIHQINDRRESQGTHSWASFFQADVEWHARDYEIRRNHDRTDVRRHAEAHDAGNGDGFSEERIESHNAAQGTAKVEAHSETLRTLSRVESQTTVILANSQRFRNLRLIYDQLTEQIAHQKRRLRQRSMPRIATIPCNCNGCCICGPTSRLSACGITSHHQLLMGLGRSVCHV